MSAPSASNVADDPLSIVLGPTDLSDIDSALENLLNDDIDLNGNDDFAIDDDDDDDITNIDINVDGDLGENLLGTDSAPPAQGSTSEQSEKSSPKPDPTSELEALLDTSAPLTRESSTSTSANEPTTETVLFHPLASFVNASAPASTPKAATSAPANADNKATHHHSRFVSAAAARDSAAEAMKSIQASVPSMMSVTSSLSTLWNQSKPQFSGSHSSSSGSLSNNFPPSYNIRKGMMPNNGGTALSQQQQQQPINSQSDATMPNSQNMDHAANGPTTVNIPGQPPNLPKTSGAIQSLLLSHIDSLIEGERIVMFLSHVKRVAQSSYPVSSSEGTWWGCAMTLYRIILFPYENNDPNNVAQNNLKVRHMGGGEWVSEKDREKKGTLIQMPLSSLDRVERIEEDMMSTSAEQNWTLVLYGKDNNRFIRFTTSTVTDSIRAHQTLNTYAFPGRRNLGYLFAFESRRSVVMSPNSVSPPTPTRFQFEEEFEQRLKLVPSIYYSKVENTEYNVCGSYPLQMIVPRVCGNGSLEGKKMLRKCAAFRSEQRLPALTWARSSVHAGIWRCSQPKVGIQGNRSAEDERYLRLMGEGIEIRRGSGLTWSERFELTGGDDGIENIEKLLIEGRSGLTVKILDMRSKASAMGNRGTGYGYETANNYPSTSLSFCNITNIHGVRDAYNKLSQLSINPNCNDAQWGSLVEDTKWLYHVRLILHASWVTAFHIHYHNLPVLVHCSHGWDRTSQVAAIAQLFLDPYYRTFDGFATLVEKDFLSFGHPFHTRAGHGEGKGERGTNSSGHGGEGQVSPIFIQFLDCVWQLVQQFPNAFEFNMRYLLVISEHIYSCRFGTLLCDNEKEREMDAKIRQRTYCLWDYLDSCREYLINDSFVQDDPESVLLPPLPLLLRNVKLWADRHLKWSPKASWLGVGKDLEEFLIPVSVNMDEKEESKTGESSNAKRRDVMSMRCAADVTLAELRKERLEKEKWQRLAKMLEKELAELKGTENGN